MRIQIEPIPMGLESPITSIELQWGNKGVFDDNLCLNILQFNSGNNLVAKKEIRMTTDEYYAFGETKQERLDEVIKSAGIVVLETAHP